MTKRKNELGTIKVVIRGTKFNDKNEEVRHFHTVSSEVLSEALESFINNISFENNIIDIPEPISKVYQKIGLNTGVKTSIDGIDYYHFSGKFIFRDQEDIKTVDTESYDVDVIEIAGTKYQFHQLHFTIIPSRGAVISDSKCYNKNLQYFWKIHLSELLSEEDYFENAQGEFFTNINVKVKSDARKDYEEVLRNSFNRIKAIGLTFGKPKKALLDSDATVEHKEEIEGMFGQMVGKLVGIDDDEAESPFMGVKVELKFSPVPRGMAEEFTGYKRNLKNRMLALTSNNYFKEGSVEYLDDDNEIQRAIRRGVAKSLPISTDVLNYDDDTIMWTEQRRAFFELRE